MATIVFTCGAECAALAHWSTITGPVSVDTGTKRTGAASIKVAAAGAATSAKYTGSASQYVTRFALYMPSVPTADAILATATATVVNDSLLCFDVATGKLAIAQQADWANRKLGPVLVAATWTIIDLRVSYAAGTPTITWAVDGVAQTTYTGTQAVDTVSAFYLGQWSNYAGLAPALTTYTAYFDDVAVSNTAGDYPLSGSVLALAPSSLRYATRYTGAASPGLAGTDSTLLQSIDFTAFGVAFVRETTAGLGARNIGFDAASDDLAAILLGIRETTTPPGPRSTPYPQLLAH